jgi:hypothetical protein
LPKGYGSLSHTSFGLKKQIRTAMDDLKKQIETLIDMETRSDSMDVISPLYVSRMLNIPIEDIEEAMRDMDV